MQKTRSLRAQSRVGRIIAAYSSLDVSGGSYLIVGEQAGKKVLETILDAWPLVALAPGLK
jgi:hypothetical protein